MAAIAWPEDWALTDSRLGAYEKCPRRFFYTHVLGLGGARNPTAFSRTHDCLYDLLRWLADARRTSTPTLAEVEAAFEAIWAQRGPADHAFAARTLADPSYAGPEFPVTIDHLRHECVGEAFVDYFSRGWPDLVH